MKSEREIVLLAKGINICLHEGGIDRKNMAPALIVTSLSFANHQKPEEETS